MKLVRFLLGVLLVPGWIGVATAAESAAAAATEIRVGIAPVYAPFAFTESGALKGIEVDFANQLATDLSVKVNLVELAWDDLIPALHQKRVDVIMSGMSITDERSKLIAFTKPYLQVGQMALIRKDDINRLSTTKQMNAAGVRVGVHRNTTGDQYAQQALKKATIKEFDSVDAGIAALRAKEIDCFIHDAPTVWRIRGQLKAQYDDLMGRYRPLTKEYLAWAVRKDKEGDALRAQLNGVLETWEDNGWIESVLDRWIPVRKVSVDQNDAGQGIGTVPGQK